LKGARKAEMPAAIEPMMAQISDHIPRGGDWLFEVKWDGVRAVAFVENESVRLQSRTGNRCERQYPELSAIPHQLAAETAILDGEIAVLDAKGVSQFHLIQPRIMNADPNSIAHMSRNTPVVYFVFDLLYLDGYDLRGVRLDERRKLLEEIVAPDAVFRVSAAFPGAGEEMLEAARENGLEGLLAKLASSRYESKRSSDWLKIKIVTQQEFVIGGFTEPQGDRSHFGALVLGVYEDGKLNWVGNAGTGFDQKTLAFLYSRLKPLITSKCPFAERPKPDRGITWVKPELTAQVKFTQWTQAKRLRAPVYLGLREDVKPEEATREGSAPEKATTGEFLADVKEATSDVDGHPLKFTNLKKVYYPDDGYTKRDVINYYDAVSALILPHLKDRPLSLKRYPNGIKDQFFFQKHAAETFAPWLRTEMIDSDHNEAPINYVFAQDRAALLYLANLGCIDQNPWMSRSGSLDNPDFVLIDLDPQHCSFDKIVEAALLVKDVLDEIGMEGYSKTTGGDGMHVYIPVEPEYTYEQTRTFSEVIARIVTRRKPDLFTTPRSVSKRERNRVYFDWVQNAKSKTIAAPYVLRAYAGAPVATPLEWSEVRVGLQPSQFNISNARERFREKGDLFEGVLKQPQRIEKALGKLEKLFR
jgi:bifunctional non-homologous end joining protein LigD